MSEKKRILVINGSPKVNNSLTIKMTRGFVEGIEDAFDCETDYLNVSEMNIKPCTGCLSCWGRTEGECIIKGDDMPKARDMILRSDIIIISFPLYFFGLPGTLKVFIDRLLGIMLTFSGQQLDENNEKKHHLRYPREGQRLAVISSSGFSEAEDVFDGVKKQFDLAIGENNYFAVCSPQLKAIAEAGSGQRFEKLYAKYKEAGRQFALNGKADPELLKELAKPQLTPKTYKVIMEKYWSDQKAGAVK
ncbi:MAG: flavodoxin family protein [Ruminococcus sp.]|nr:flavodoxin family protein [Ruminococcus sp.]